MKMRLNVGDVIIQPLAPHWIPYNCSLPGHVLPYVGIYLVGKCGEKKIENALESARLLLCSTGVHHGESWGVGGGGPPNITSSPG